MNKSNAPMCDDYISHQERVERINKRTSMVRILATLGGVVSVGTLATVLLGNMDNKLAIGLKEHVDAIPQIARYDEAKAIIAEKEARNSAHAYLRNRDASPYLIKVAQKALKDLDHNGVFPDSLISESYASH